jgi:hypothetical protein
MTAMTASAQPGPDARMRPVPWSKLAWVSWRQYRVALAGAVIFLGALAVYLLIMGLKIRSAYASVASCHPASSAACLDASSLFSNAYYITAEVTAALLEAVPVLVGVFAGAPILARELDSGTSRFAWTQGAGRIRWTVARLALPAVTVTAATAAFSQLFGWFYWPFFADGLDGPLAPQFFDLTGVALAAWTLAAFAIGALAGVLIRRAVPAMVASMATWAGLLAATLYFLRRHYETPLITKSGGPPGSGTSPWVISQWWTAPNGKPVSLSTIMQLAQDPHALQGAPTVHPKPGPGGGSIFQGLLEHGYTEWTSYQPAARFWTFQWIEGGWLLALSLLLIAATIWLVRRRAA